MTSSKAFNLSNKGIMYFIQKGFFLLLSVVVDIGVCFFSLIKSYSWVNGFFLVLMLCSFLLGFKWNSLLFVMTMMGSYVYYRDHPIKKKRAAGLLLILFFHDFRDWPDVLFMVINIFLHFLWLLI